jgi:hypothetical protein
MGFNDMPKEKRKKGFFDLFGPDEDFLFDAKSFSEGGSGYSVSVTYDEKGKPVVKVQTHGDLDATELRRDIEQRYPGAKIEGLEKQPLIRVVDEEPTSEAEKKKKEERKEPKKEKKKKKEPLIRVVK